MKKYINYCVNTQYRRQTLIKWYLTLKEKNSFAFKVISLLLKNYIISNCNIIISMKAKIGKNIYFPHPQNIIIGDGSIVGDNCTIYHDVTLGQNHGKYPVIGDNVIIYPGAKIIGDVKVGNDAIIGANAVVVKDVLDNQIVGGVPAKVIGVNSDGKEFY